MKTSSNVEIWKPGPRPAGAAGAARPEPAGAAAVGLRVTDLGFRYTAEERHFAEEMLKNKAWGHLHVWLSGSTEPPTISLGEGLWFLEALDLYKELKKLTKK